MSVVQQLYTAHATIGGHQITYREVAGDVFGVASAIGGMRRRVWAWPVGIVGNVLLFTVFFGVAFHNPQGATLYGQSGRQLMFIGTSVYGWYRWTHREAGSSEAVTPTWATAGERLIFGLSALTGVGVCFVIFRAIGAGFPAAWWYYLADSWIFIGSLLATYAMARGWIDFWLCWILVDVVGVPELLHFQYYPSAVLYGFYAGFVIWGFAVWSRIARTEPRSVGLSPLQGVAG
jgi:nicotinamide mononucleotide transporter